MQTVCLVSFPEKIGGEWISKLKDKFSCISESHLFNLFDKKDNIDWVLIYVSPLEGSSNPIVMGYGKNGSCFVVPFDLKAVWAKLSVGIGRGEIIDWALVNAFIDATKEVLSMMAGVEVEKREVFTQKDSKKVYGDVSGVIGFTGTQELAGEINGSVAITLPLNSAQKIVASMLMLEPSEIKEGEITDGVGELINMIAGDAKAKYNDNFKISLPTVVTGHNHTIGGASEIARVAVKFEDQDGEELFLQICLEEK